jgi:hypothetical protein
MLLRSWLGAALLTASVSLAALALLRNPGSPTARAEARTSGLEIEIEMPALKQPPNVAAPRAEPEALLQELPVHPRERRPAPLVTRPTTVPDLARAAGWMRSIAVHEALPKLASPEAERARLEDALSKATNPVARQNVIFLAVLTLPADVSHPWLSSMMGGGLGGDAEDAVLALAFDGDPQGRADFGWLSATPSRAAVHRLLDHCADHEKLGEAGTEEAREILRSYRALEVLDREPYFKSTFHWTSHAEWLPHPIRRLEEGELADDASMELDRELLDRWVARYPGHPGSDDMAFRLGRVELRRGEALEAARWFSRSATMPDQDMCGAAVRDLAATCEALLTPEELDRLAHEQGLLTPNRVLIQYIRLRRLAAERGFDVAIRYASALGRDEPHSVLGYAWNFRNAAPPPKGLDSGMAPAPPDDPLRAMLATAPPFVRHERALPPERIPAKLKNQCETEESRLDPWPERLQIDETLLMGQFRAWEALVTLERRTAQASGEERADLLYKTAAILYHDPRTILPAYAEVFSLGWLVQAVSDDAGRDPRAFGTFVRTSYPLLRAIGVFERIEREHPTYTGMDKVLYSEGVAWGKFLDYPCKAEEGRTWDAKIRNAVGAFERCATYFPSSALADDARRAALYWRSEWPGVFE